MELCIHQKIRRFCTTKYLQYTAHTIDNVQQFQDLDHFKVRKVVLEELKNKDLLVKEEKHPISVPRGERSNIVIEPRLSYQ